MTCSSCRHYRPDSDGPAGVSGDCRRHAPTALAYVSADEHGEPSVQSATIWPVVAPTDGCGDWEARKAIPGRVPTAGGMGIVHSESNAPRG